MSAVTTTARSAGKRIGGLGVRLAFSLALLVILLVAWQIAATATVSPFFPPPLKIVARMRELFFGGEASTLFLTPAITVDAANTVARLLVGFVVGAIGGIVVGVVIGLSRIANQTISPVVEFLRSIPATASLPLFIILLGGDDGMRIAFIAWGISWFVLINTASGVSTIHPTLLSVGAAFKLSGSRRLVGIVLPAALPKIFAGLRIGLTGALLLAVVSEFLLATNGIGFQLVQAQRRFQILDMWSWMLALAVLGLLLNTILEIIENRLLAWHRLSRD